MRGMRLTVVLLQTGWLVACGGGGSSGDGGGGFDSIAGTWMMAEHCADGCELNVLFPSGTGVYGLYWPDHPAEPGIGVQRFTYTWDPTSTRFAITGIQMDTTGDWNEASTHPAVLWAPTGANSASIEGVGEIDRLTSSASNVLQGTWTMGDPSSGSYAVAVFLSDGRYLLMEEGPTDADGQTGIEVGTYAWNSGTGALTVAVEPDGNTDGDWGFSAAGSVNVTVTGATATFSIDGGTPRTITRLEPAP